MFEKKFEELKLTGNLPSPSGVGLGILRITQDDNFVLDELATAISADPALTGRILKLANSAAGSGIEELTCVKEASLRLGTRTVRSVALGFSLISANRSGVCEEFDYNRYWSLSLASALAAQTFARHAGMAEAADVFTCSLLSRVGMLALATVHPARYSGVLRSTRGSSLGSLLEAEANAFDITHPEVTAAMMRDWRLPDSFSEVALRLGHETRESAIQDESTRRLCAAVHVGWVLAPHLVSSAISEESAPESWSMLEHIARARSVELELLRETCTSVAKTWGEWRRMLRLGESAAAPQQRSAAPGPRDEKPDVSSLLATNESRVSIEPLVMIVDDDERILRLLTHLLEKDGFRLIAARDGEEALRVAKESTPDIIITDWMMPRISGIELCRELKRIEALRNSYIIMLTAKENVDRVIESFEAGADDYVTKPFSPLILMGRVRAGRRLLELQLQLERDRDVRTAQVAELGAMTRKLRSVTLTDMLTELPNRRYARKRLIEEWNASLTRNEPLSLIMIDIDHFKRVNDGFGHDVGDQVLYETAQALKDNTRLGDVVCRIGGEEFLVINVNCDGETAVQCAERLRTAVEQRMIEYGGFSGNVTVSLGVAERAPETESPDQLMKDADRAVYRAKNGGRNRTVRFDRPRGAESA